MALKSLALTPAEAKDTYLGCAPCDAGEDNGPKYPWGTELNLEDDSLKKLGIEKLPEVGEVVNIMAQAKVTRVSASESQSGARRSLALQITDMAVDNPSQSRESKLYGNTTENPLT